MSNPNLPKVFDKILQENVLSGDFKVANFKSNLKEFLKFIAATFSFLGADKDQSFVDSTIDALCSKLVASNFTKPKSPKTSRLYLSVIYGSRVLGLEFLSNKAVRDHLTARYGSNLVFATDTIELAAKHVGAFSRKRKASDDDNNSASKRQKILDANTISTESQEEQSEAEARKRTSKPVERFHDNAAEGLIGDFSPAEYEDFAKSVKMDEKQAGKISKQARKYLDYLHRHDVQLIVEKRTIRRIKIGEEGEAIDVTNPIVIIIDDDESYASMSTSSESSSDLDSSSESSSESKLSSKKPKKKNKTTSSTHRRASKKKEKSTNSNERATKSPAASPLKTKVNGTPNGSSFDSFLAYLRSRSLDSETFRSISEQLIANQPLQEITMEFNSPLLPSAFLNCWFNELLANVSKEDVLRECSVALQPVVKGLHSLKIHQKAQLFVVGTVLEALHVQCTKDIQATLPANSDCTVAINEALIAKLEQSAAFKSLQQLGIFRRDFTTAANKKEVFRAFKSEIKKFTTLCRVSPAIVFNDASFDALITKSPSTEVLLAQWPLLSDRDHGLDAVYFMKWPSVYEIN